VWSSLRWGRCAVDAEEGATDADVWGLSHSNGGYVKILIRIQTDSNYIQILSNFDRSKKNLPELKKFEIKYGCEGFEERKNFLQIQNGFQMKIQRSF
jgi:hypothetical protein